MRFGDFLKVTVLLCAGSATLLAAITILTATRDDEQTLALVAVAWWTIASILGLRYEERAKEGIRSLMAEARQQMTLPELRPASTLLTRLWLLLFVTVAAGAIGAFVPQVPAVAAGFALLVALAWRRQGTAVEAIELRDAARFYVDRTSPFEPIRLIRTPGFGGADLKGQPG